MYIRAHRHVPISERSVMIRGAASARRTERRRPKGCCWQSSHLAAGDDGPPLSHDVALLSPLAREASEHSSCVSTEHSQDQLDSSSQPCAQHLPRENPAAFMYFNDGSLRAMYILLVLCTYDVCIYMYVKLCIYMQRCLFCIQSTYLWANV